MLKFKNKPKFFAVFLLTVFFIVMGCNLLSGCFTINSGVVNISADNSGSGNSQIKNSGYGVVSDNPEASAIGIKILEQGGNAVDAAIAVSYALGVTSPFASGIGGGGIMLVYPGDGSDPVVYDYMGVSPENTASSIAVPGFVKGMETAQADFGQLSMTELLDPAINLAKEGVQVTPVLNRMIENSEGKIDSDVRANFFIDGTALSTGSLLKQPELAVTLEQLKLKGADDFYQGDLAMEIANSNCGLTLKDLSAYQIITRTPLYGSYGGYQVTTADLPSGGVTLIQMLALAEKAELDRYPEDSFEYISLLSNISEVCYNDRYSNVIDPDFYPVAGNKLTSEQYINNLNDKVESFNIENNIHQSDSPAEANNAENTTHFVVYDQNGMMVSVTNTLTYWFGDGRNVGGFFMNAHMANFSTSTTSQNRAEVGKRPRSFIAPTILAKNGKPVLGIGSPGGSRIPLMIVEVLERFLKKNTPLQKSVDDPRFYLENRDLYLENNYITTATEDKLRKDGFSIIKYNNPLFYGSVNALFVDEEKGILTGGADGRRGASVLIKGN